MHVCLDVGYCNSSALAACVGLHDWTDSVAAFTCCQTIDHVARYESGKFFQRELPCLLAVLASVQQPISTIVIDGNVRLDNPCTPGLGQYLYEAIDEQSPVIGVAKSKFEGLDSAQILLRGNSTRPLYITAAGMDELAASEFIGSMHGPFRIPTLLKLVDRLSRQ